MSDYNIESIFSIKHIGNIIPDLNFHKKLNQIIKCFKTSPYANKIRDSLY